MKTKSVLMPMVMLSLAAAAPAAAAPADLDPAFGDNGQVRLPIGPSSGADAMAVQPDGKIVIAGDRYFDGVNGRDILVVRLNPDGSLDQSFGDGGTQIVDGYPHFDRGSDDSAAGVAIQPDGRIVVVGNSYEFPPCAGPGGACTEFVVLARLSADGHNEPDFGDEATPGRRIYGWGSDAHANGVLVRANGKLAVVGKTYLGTDPENDEALVWEWDSNGGPVANAADVLWAGHGNTDGRALIEQPDGKLVMLGVTAHGSDHVNASDFLFARLGDGLEYDAGFGVGNGRYAVGFGRGDAGNALVQRPGGELVAAGYSGGDFGFTQLGPDGLIDRNFGTQGISFLDFGANDTVFSAALQPDGKLLASGTTTDDQGRSGDLVVGRVNPNGSPDAGFGVEGRAYVDFGGNDELGGAMALQPDGKILVAGTSFPNGNGEIVVARLKGDSVDPPAQPQPGTPEITSGKVRVTKNGVAPIEVTCVGQGNCDGSVALATAAKFDPAQISRKRRKRRVKLGSKRFSIPAGQTRTVRVKLKRKGFRLLKRKRRLRVRATVRSRDAAGASSVSHSRLTLKAPKQRQRRS